MWSVSAGRTNVGGQTRLLVGKRGGHTNVRGSNSDLVGERGRQTKSKNGY